MRALSEGLSTSTSPFFSFFQETQYPNGKAENIPAVGNGNVWIKSPSGRKGVFIQEIPQQTFFSRGMFALQMNKPASPNTHCRNIASTRCACLDGSQHQTQLTTMQASCKAVSSAPCTAEPQPKCSPCDGGTRRGTGALRGTQSCVITAFQEASPAV